jgi:transcriptional regulator GlxA family with amidase domain
MVGVYESMADWEIGHVMAHINSGDWQIDPDRYHVRTVGESGEAVKTMGGVKIIPDLTLDELTPEDNAMLILAGADIWLEGGNEAFSEKARGFLAAGIPVAAICGATFGLARAGLLDERRHTSNAPEVLAMADGYDGADLYRDELAVSDGDVITASGIAPVEFAREIFARLDLYEPQVLDAWYKLYGRHDPAGYTELVAATQS